MNTQIDPRVEVPARLVEAIRSLPPTREVEHCGGKFAVSSFDIYAECPRCKQRIKVRAFSAGEEIEDVFDAVFEWMTRPEAHDVAQRRIAAVEAESYK
jgi:hypothetical protein